MSVNRSNEFLAYFNITDAAGKAISGVSVTLDGETQTTDDEGDVFFFKNIGSYECEISSGGYKTFSETVNIDSSGEKHSVVMSAAGVSYDEDGEILNLEAGYTAWTEPSGGEELHDGDTVEKDALDRFIYIDNGSAKRIPFVIPGTPRIWIQDVKPVEGSGDKQIEVTVENYNWKANADMVLIGGLYDGTVQCIKTLISDVSDLAAGTKKTVTLDFGQDISGYTCKLYLWFKGSMTPVCPRWYVSE